MPYRLCEEHLLEQPVEQLCYRDVRLCGKKKRMRCVNILITEILVKYQGHHIVN